VLGIFLFTGLGTSPSSSGAPHEGGQVPSFTASNIGPIGPSRVSVSGNGSPTVTSTVDGFVFEDAYRVAGPGWAPGGAWYRGVRAREEA